MSSDLIGKKPATRIIGRIANGKRLPLLIEDPPSLGAQENSPVDLSGDTAVRGFVDPRTGCSFFEVESLYPFVRNIINKSKSLEEAEKAVFAFFSSLAKPLPPKDDGA